MALKSDGTVVSWGSNAYGQCDVPADLTGVTAISAGVHTSAALKSDGTVVMWGQAAYGWTAVPPGLDHVVAISSCPSDFFYPNNAPLTYTLALRSDGTIVSWGASDRPDSFQAALGPFKSIAASYYSVSALREDGTIVRSWYPSPLIQKLPFHVRSISAGVSRLFALGTMGQLYPSDDFVNVPTHAGPVAVRSAAEADDFVYVVVDSRVDLGLRDVGSAPVSRQLTIRNTGILPLNLGEISLLGNPGDFSIDTAGVPAVLPPRNGVATFTVTYTPTSRGLQTATLRVRSDDADQNNFDLMVTGIGYLPPASFADWQELYLQDAANSASCPAGDPNGNGLTNVMEYALGGDPMGSAPGLSVLPNYSFNATGHLQLQFDRYPGRAGITAVVQAADSPGGPWTDVASSVNGAPYGVLVSGASVTESGSDESRQVTVSDFLSVTDPAHPARFMRLQVQETAP
ncbi:MAG: hypothetical protein JWO82_2874 [Akkermansiaceae bacterium]|nr:hypothetical protein [Akkermansiaceae bacterium]